ncbi:MAG TPA: hypothetical protein VG714_06415 [Acidobacteriaceae bacterium]|nr:hypothetical protein [Acidobacteriaceae bacterium]
MSPIKMFKYFAGAALIADGVIALVDPKRDALAWNSGPRPWRCLMTTLAEHPTLTRAVAALEIAAGIAWASQALEPDESAPLTSANPAEI